jgi:hypothetical protein
MILRKGMKVFGNCKEYFSYLCGMKKTGIYALSTVVALAYVSSVVGVGVHTCQHSGKQRIMLLAHEACLCGHEQEQLPASACCGDEVDEDGCCDVAYRILKVDQETHGAQSLLKNIAGHPTWLFVPAMTPEWPHAAPAVAFNHSPPPCTSNTLPSIYRLSQLRL